MSQHHEHKPERAASRASVDLSYGPKSAPGDPKVDFAEAMVRREAFLARLARMSAEERLRAARFGDFSNWERSLWAARFPEEVPLVNGEYEWIALTLADLD